MSRRSNGEGIVLGSSDVPQILIRFTATTLSSRMKG
jgi:hypothetical protein